MPVSSSMIFEVQNYIKDVVVSPAIKLCPQCNMRRRHR
jgi:hypothetical protein